MPAADVAQLATRPAVESRPLPDGEVGEPDGQGRPLGCLAAQPRPVGGDQIGGKDLAGTAIGDDVMQQDRQHTVLLVENKKPYPQQRFGRQVEDVAGVGIQLAVEALLAAVEYHHRHLERLGGMDQLIGRRIVLGERRPQRLMPGHNIIHRCDECFTVDRTFETQRIGHVLAVDGPLHATLHPVGTLGIRQRDVLGTRLRSRHHPHRRRSIGVGCGRTVRTRVDVEFRVTVEFVEGDPEFIEEGLTDGRGECRDRRTVERDPHVEFHAELGADHGDQPGREQ